MNASREYFSTADLHAAQLPGLPSSLRSLQRMAEDWKLTDRAQKRPGRAGEWEFHVSLLPEPARLKLALIHQSPANDDRSEAAARKAALWARHESLPAKHKAEAARRLSILDAVAKLAAATGMAESVAAKTLAAEMDFAASSYWNWRQKVDGSAREDWLAALAPSWTGKKDACECHPDAWQLLLDDFLRLSKPKFSAVYRRVDRVAKEKGWTPFPAERALRRRFEKEVPNDVRTLMREGRDKARLMIPQQRRTVKDLHALQAVNMDGHKLDVFTSWPGHEKPIRPVLVAIQDLYSRKILAWRLSDSENRETVRLAIGDLVTQWGIPEQWTLDNGRSFASKWISGGLPNRFRFKVKEDDPQGLLVTLGINLNWAMPGRGQSKPIERAFGDLAEAISRHPACEGAYTGNNPLAKPENYATRAVSRDTILGLCALEIAAHNARPGRRTEMANGLSFDAVFAASYAKSIITKATAAQESLWLLAAERIRAQKGSGVVHFMGNRYYSPALSAHAGKSVTLRFDPDNLHQAIKVYDSLDRLICDAPIFDDTGFYDRSAARLRQKDERAFLKSTSEAARLTRKMDAEALGRLYLSGKVDKAETPAPKTRRIAVKGGAMPALRDVINPDDFEAPKPDSTAALGNFLTLIQGGAD